MDHTGTLITREQQKPGVWSGGTTRLIYADGAGATPADASLWIGTATIDRDSDYSYFPNRTRIHMPTAGNGIHLQFQDPPETITLPTFSQHQFDGGRPVHAKLIDGPIAAFNLIAHPAIPATVQAHSLAPGQVLLQELANLTEPALHLIYLISGSLEIAAHGSIPATLQAEDAFIIHPDLLHTSYQPERIILLHTLSKIIYVTALNIRIHSS